MSTNGTNVCEDAEMDCDGEKVVTMMDVLKEQEDFEEDANAVLGASDDKNCTYSKGYIKRQAIYACMTCLDSKNDPTKWAGICLACSLNCHENHELIELYTKRNFRCDCGNPKFNSHPCQFTSNKTDLNVENVYNQNFSGIYCICHRPYPDPESDTQGEMIQCIICEDWLHSNHLDAVMPSNDQYSEMICKSCMDKNDFLHDYSDLVVNKVNMIVDILNNSSEASTLLNSEGNSNTVAIENDNIENYNSDNIVKELTENGDVVDKENDEDATTKVKEQDSTCEKQSIIKISDSVVSSSESNLTLNEEELTELDNDKKAETKQEDDNETEESHDNTVGKESSLTKERPEPIADTDPIDNRSSEQVEEDLLLEDPMETTINQINNATKFGASVDIKFNPSGLSNNEKKYDPETMDIAESISEEQLEQNGHKVELRKESNNDHMPSTKQTANAATEESGFGATEQSESAATEESVFGSTEQSGSAATEKSVFGATEQLKIASTAEQAENKVNFEESECIATERVTENVITTEISKNTITTEQLENITPVQQDEGTYNTNTNEVLPTEPVESVTEITGNTKNNVVEYSEHLPSTEQTENIAITGHSTTEPITEQPEDKPTIIQNEQTDESESVCTIKQLENIVTNDQLDQHNTNGEKNVSSNENNTDREESGVEEENFTDVAMDENNIDDAFNNDNKNAESEVKSNCDNETPNKKIYVDILKRKLSSDDDIQKKKPKLEQSKCVRPRAVKKVHHGATFWASNFRHKLCTCNECISMYRDLSVLFLIDPDDTVTAYERLGKEITHGKPASQYEKGMAALSSLGRVQQINALTEYAKLRDKLLDFLKTFKDKKVIVKEEDIKAFFADMKPVREPDGVYFCR